MASPVSSPSPPSPADLDLLEKTKNKNVGWQMAFAGAVSGAASRTLVAPFDRVKLLAQVAAVPGSLSNSSPASPSSSSSSSSSSPSMSLSSSSSSVARATARRSTAATLRAIYEADGVRGLFRGNVAALLRTIPYSAVQLSTHDLLKRQLAAKQKGGAEGGGGEASPSSPSTSTPSPVALPTEARLAAAAGAGVAAAAVSHPLDTLRLRLALPTATATASGADASRASAAASSSLIATAATVVRTEGFFSLYRGLSAAVLGAAPFSAISLMTFDRLQFLAAAKRKREWSEQTLQLLQLPRGQGEQEVLPDAQAATMRMFLPATSPPSLSPLSPPQAPAWEAALAGAFAGAVASTATYPIDTLRRRLQLPTSTSVAGCVGAVPEESSLSAAAAKANSLRSSHTRSLFSAAATAIRHDGFFSLYRGWVVGKRLVLDVLTFSFER